MTHDPVTDPQVLLADDDHDAVDALGRLLPLLLGADVAVAYDGSAAVEQARRRRPGVAVLDLAMPRLDGVGAAHAIRALYPDDPPLLLALTGVGRAADELADIDDVFDHVLAKPPDMDRLTALIRRHQLGAAGVPEHSTEVAELLFAVAKGAARLVDDTGRWSLTCRYKGPRALLGGDVTQLRREMTRLLRSAIASLRSGLVLMEAQFEALPADGGRLTLTAAGGGPVRPLAEVRQLAARLGIDGSPAAESHAWHGEGVSAGTLGRLECRWSPGGVLFRCVVEQRRLRALPDPTMSRVDGARAWVVDRDAVHATALRRRLEARGWNVQTFADAQAAAARLDNGGPDAAPPALVLIGDDAGVEPAIALQTLLGPATGVVLLGWRSAAARRPLPVHAGIDLKLHPLTPAELEALTQQHGGGSPGPVLETAPVALAAPAGGTVLVVDDQEINRMIETAMLEALGFRAETASDGLDAVEHCKHHPPQAVLMDVDMRVLSGIAATQRLRQLQREGTIPDFRVIAVTAHDDPAYRQRCLDAGMDAYLTKPVDFARLGQELQRLAPGGAPHWNQPGSIETH